MPKKLEKGARVLSVTVDTGGRERERGSNVHGRNITLATVHERPDEGEQEAIARAQTKQDEACRRQWPWGRRGKEALFASWSSVDQAGMAH